MLGRDCDYRRPAPEAWWTARRCNGRVLGGRRPNATGKGRASGRQPALLACLLFLGASGCTYLRYRGEDALDMIDICSDDGRPRGRWPWAKEAQEDLIDRKSEKGVEDEED